MNCGEWCFALFANNRQKQLMENTGIEWKSWLKFHPQIIA